MNHFLLFKGTKTIVRRSFCLYVYTSLHEKKSGEKVWSRPYNLCHLCLCQCRSMSILLNCAHFTNITIYSRYSVGKTNIYFEETIIIVNILQWMTLFLLLLSLFFDEYFSHCLSHECVSHAYLISIHE
jgi:hypothetical protein